MANPRVYLATVFLATACSPSANSLKFVFDESTELCSASTYGIDPLVALRSSIRVVIHSDSGSARLATGDGRDFSGSVPYEPLEAKLEGTLKDYVGGEYVPAGRAEGLAVDNWTVYAEEVVGYNSAFFVQPMSTGTLRARFGFGESQGSELNASEASELYGQFLPEGAEAFGGIDGAWPLVRCRDSPPQVREELTLETGGSVVVERVLFNDTPSLSFSTNQVATFAVDLDETAPPVGSCVRIVYTPIAFSELRYAIACQLEPPTETDAACTMVLRDIHLSNASPEPTDMPRLELLDCEGQVLWSAPVLSVDQIVLD